MKKYFLLVCVLFLLNSCKDDPKQTSEAPTEIESEEFKFNEIALDSTMFEDCQGVSCPKIKVDYIEMEGAGSYAQSVNLKNSKELIELLHINEEKPIAKDIAEAVRDFGEEYFEYEKSYPNSAGTYELKLEQEIKSKNESTLVLETVFYIYTGGAHGYSGTHFLNFDAKTGKYLTQDDLINDIPAFTDFVEKAFRRQYEIPTEADINAQGFFFDDGKFVLPENIAVSDESVILIYNPYEAASYAQGPLRFFFPKKTVGQWFNY